MRSIKELTDKIYSALYGEEIRSAIIESFMLIDKKIKWIIALLSIQGMSIIILAAKIILLTQ